MTVKELIEKLQRNFKPDDVIAHDLWQIEDVKNQCKNRDIELSDQQCVDVLESMEHYKDCTIGLNWDVMDNYIDNQ